MSSMLVQNKEVEVDIIVVASEILVKSRENFNEFVKKTRSLN